MTAVIVIGIIVILAVSILARGSRSRSAQVGVLTEREAAERLRPYSGAADYAPQQPPVD